MIFKADVNIMIPGTDSKGFSLVELMVAVGIIAILAAIAIPSYLGVQKKAARSKAKANLEAIGLVLEGYMAENNDYGTAGTYNYVCGSSCASSTFGHDDSNLEETAKLGGGHDYDYRISVTATPGFSVFAIPQRGRVIGDVTISLDSNGIKIPVGVW